MRLKRIRSNSPNCTNTGCPRMYESTVSTNVQSVVANFSIPLNSFPKKPAPSKDGRENLLLVSVEDRSMSPNPSTVTCGVIMLDFSFSVFSFRVSLYSSRVSFVFVRQFVTVLRAVSTGLGARQCSNPSGSVVCAVYVLSLITDFSCVLSSVSFVF